MNLSGKKVAITGANGTLGRAVSEKALELGASVVLLDVVVSDDPIESSQVEYKVVDLCDCTAVEKCFSDTGELDAVFNLAGGFSMGPAVHEISDKEWDFLFNINVKSLLPKDSNNGIDCSEICRSVFSVG